MEFDKSRIYTALNADELHEGDKVIVADDLSTLKRCVKDNSPIDTIRMIGEEDFIYRFGVKDNAATFALAYLVERRENCTNCEYEGSAGCSIVEICGENKLTHRCHMYKAKDTKRNLCDSCKYSFAECSATVNDVVYGVGNDNVYECDKYEQKSTVRCINCEHYSTYEGYCNKHVKPTMYDNTNCKYYNKVNDYEQKAEKHYRPFKNTDELIKVWDAKIGTPKWGTDGDLTMPHIWVREKGCEKSAGLITCYGSKGITVRGKGMYFDTLFTMFEFLDGSPCGVEE